MTGVRRVSKLFILCVFFGTLMPVFADADPFLVSDPYGPDSLQPTGFVVTVNGRVQNVEPTRRPDGSAYLRYDLKDLPDGEHLLKVKAVNILRRTESTEEEYGIRKKDGMCTPKPKPRTPIPPSRTYPGHIHR